jgi:hypothetical protein
MDDISKTDALNIFSKWERQNQSFSVLRFSPSMARSTKGGRVAMCLDESLELSLADDTRLLPAESRNLVPEFEQGMHINFLEPSDAVVSACIPLTRGRSGPS